MSSHTFEPCWIYFLGSQICIEGGDDFQCLEASEIRILEVAWGFILRGRSVAKSLRVSRVKLGRGEFEGVSGLRHSSLEGVCWGFGYLVQAPCGEAHIFWCGSAGLCIYTVLYVLSPHMFAPIHSFHSSAANVNFSPHARRPWEFQHNLCACTITFWSLCFWQWKGDLCYTEWTLTLWFTCEHKSESCPNQTKISEHLNDMYIWVDAWTASGHCVPFCSYQSCLTLEITLLLPKTWTLKKLDNIILLYTGLWWSFMQKYS